MMDMYNNVGSMYVDYIRSAVGYMCNVGGILVSGALTFASSVECMYTSAPGHIVDCREVIWHYIYIYI